VVLGDARINALCLGPGLGVERAAELVAVALGGGGAKLRPTVLDADALTAMAENPELFAMLHDKCVLTPHAGEFARLFPDIAEKLTAQATRGPAYSRVDATRDAAKRAGCVVLFKGADTVIADAQGRAAINSAHYGRAAPWLATAGSGDVLAGFITGLMARGFASMQAAETAAWLHVECALAYGPGMIAEDIPEELPKVFARLEIRGSPVHCPLASSSPSTYRIWRQSNTGLNNVRVCSGAKSINSPSIRALTGTSACSAPNIARARQSRTRTG
jgi:hydroxyethylthiazole kinase-like uncharacterized protein yjeF